VVGARFRRVTAKGVGAITRGSGEHEIRPHGSGRFSRRGLLPRCRTHGKAGISDDVVALNFSSVFADPPGAGSALHLRHFSLDDEPTVAFVAQGPRSGPFDGLRASSAASRSVSWRGDHRHGKLNYLSRAVKATAWSKSRKAGMRALRYFSYPCGPTAKLESATTLQRRTSVQHVPIPPARAAVDRPDPRSGSPGLMPPSFHIAPSPGRAGNLEFSLTASPK
jgi:hypothetical protein